MGYDVHITRKQHSWADIEDDAIITLDEWQEYVASDPEMRLDNRAEAPVCSTKDRIAVEDEGMSVWLPYSKNGRAGNYAWFSHEHDRIIVKNPDEEILSKMLFIAHALGARVQGDDGEYFDEATPIFGSRPEENTSIWASSDFRDFQTFASVGAAEPLLQMLGQAGIAYRTISDTGQVAFDPSFANNQLTSKFVVKLQLADFERGSQVLNSLHQHALSQLDPEHYIFRFSDEELMDIAVKPDEWSALDVALAGQLLRKRGRDVSADALQLLRQRRVAELDQPDQDHKALVRSGYLSALLGGIIGFFIGYQLYTSRKQLPTGQRVYSYSPTDRVHGLRIMVLGTSVFILVMAARLIRIMED